MDPAKETELIQAIPNSIFSGKFIIKDKNKAFLKTKFGKTDLKLLCDEFKLDKGSIKAAIA